jgi:hypothetical protein
VRPKISGYLTPTTKSIESIPNFTDPAAKLWRAIPTEFRKKLLANVWCGHCAEAVIIKNYTGAVKAGNLLLVGQCPVCHEDVARVIESA